MCRRAFVRDTSAGVGRREAASAAADRRREWLGAASVATVKGGAARLGSLVCDWWRLALYFHQVAHESELHTTDSATSNARHERDTEAAETARDRLQRMTSIISNWGTW